jgi:hypothetical protein
VVVFEVEVVRWWLLGEDGYQVSIPSTQQLQTGGFNSNFASCCCQSFRARQLSRAVDADVDVAATLRINRLRYRYYWLDPAALVRTRHELCTHQEKQQERSPPLLKG